MDVPLCACHGEPRQWAKDSRRKAGGYWRCGVERRAARARYDNSYKGRADSARYFEKRYYSDDPKDRLWVLKRQLQKRRHGALKSMEFRHQRLAEERGADG